MKVKVYFRQILTHSYSLAIVHVPDNTENVKEWLKTHLKGLGLKANYIKYEEM
jgi:uncharacterized protein YgfB (UPF0149 family)